MWAIGCFRWKANVHRTPSHLFSHPISILPDWFQLHLAIYIRFCFPFARSNKSNFQQFEITLDAQYKTAQNVSLCIHTAKREQEYHHHFFLLNIFLGPVSYFPDWPNEHRQCPKRKWETNRKNGYEVDKERIFSYFQHIESNITDCCAKYRCCGLNWLNSDQWGKVNV